MPDRIINSNSVKAGTIILGLLHTDKDKILRKVPFGTVYQSPSGFTFTEYDEDNLPTVMGHKPRTASSEAYEPVTGHEFSHYVLTPAFNVVGSIASTIPGSKYLSILSPVLLLGTAVSHKAPWNNSGFQEIFPGNLGEDLNNYTNLALLLAGSKVAPKIGSFAQNTLLPRPIRFIQGIKDRHDGMIYALQVADRIKGKYGNAFEAASKLWAQNGSSGEIYGKTRLHVGPASYKGREVFSIDDIPVIEPEGRTTVTAHLGGGQLPNLNTVNNMPTSYRKYTFKFVNGLPRGTQMTERGVTVPFAELYYGTNPSWFQAIIDNIANRKVVNRNYTMEKVDVLGNAIRRGHTRPEILELHRWYDENLPLSMDSYALMLKMALNKKFGLTYDSTPMGFFNAQGNSNKALYTHMRNLPLNELLEAVNSWIKDIDPNARPAYISNGKIQIPRLILVKQ